MEGWGWGLGKTHPYLIQKSLLEEMGVVGMNKLKAYTPKNAWTRWLVLEKSIFSAAEWAPSISSSLTLVSTLNFLWINPKVMNQKILSLLCFCYEFLILGVCNSGALSCSDLKWLENWVRRFQLGGKYFLRDCLVKSKDRKMTERMWFLGLLNSNKNKIWMKVREKC